MKSTQRFVATLMLGVGAVGFSQGCAGQSQATKDQVRRIGEAADRAIEDSDAGPAREKKYLDSLEFDRASIARAGGDDPAELTDKDLLRFGYAMCELVAAGDATWDELRSSAQARIGADAEAIRVRLLIIGAARARLC